MAHPQPCFYLANRCRMWCQHIVVLLSQSIKRQLGRPTLFLLMLKLLPGTTPLAHPLSSLQTGTPVRAQNDRTKLWDRSGVVIDVGPHQKYFIYLPSGRILTRHHPFLRRRYSSSLPPSDTPKPPHPDQKPPLLTTPAYAVPLGKS